MKLLFLREKTDIRMQLLKSKLEELGHRVDIFDMVNFELIENGKTKKILKKGTFFDKMLPLVLLKRLIAAWKMYKLLNNDYDACHIFSLKRQNFWLIPKLKEKVKKIVVMVYGPSTFEFPTKRILFSSVYKYIDIITFSNPEFRERFNKIYNGKYEDKARLMMIPFKIFEQIDNLMKTESSDLSRKKLGINDNLKSVLCSTSGMALENHIMLIDSITNIIDNKDKFLFIFMLTYGGTPSYIDKIKNYIKEKLANHLYIIFDKYLSNEDVARLRQATDIMINVRQKDQITGHLLETLYSGGIVITGDWLPYKMLDDWKIFYIKISSITEIPMTLDNIINNYDNYKQRAQNNKSILQSFLNEDNIVNDWIEIYRN